jgi:hypothetical protein
MSDEERSKSWWHTLPGVITGLTATITAVAGLIVAIKQTGWFGPDTPPVVTAPSSPTPTTLPSPVAPTAPIQDTPTSTSASTPARQSHSVDLPAMRDYKLGESTFTLLKAEVSPQTAEKDALQVRIRLMNHGPYDRNFWVGHSG